MSNDGQITTRTPGQIVLTILTNSLLVISGFLSGAVTGGLYVKLFVPRAAMGWDGIADALGGLMLGGLTGVVVSIILISTISVRHRLMVATIECVLVLIVIAGMFLTQEPKPGSAPDVPRRARPDGRPRANGCTARTPATTWPRPRPLRGRCRR